MSSLSHNDPPCFRPGSLIAPINKFCSFSIVATHTSPQTRFNLTFLKLADLHFYLRTYKKLSQPNFSTSYVAALFCPFACSAGSGKSIQDEPICSYLIFVTNAANAVRVNFLAECKKIPEKRENYCFGLRLYRSSNVLFYTKCVILHLVCNFTLSV